MSHDATNWAISQKGLKPAAKIVLWHLADRHNPDIGCFPSQAQLAEDCEMSPRSVRDQLATLETAGLIRKEHVRRKGQFGFDRYFLACEKEFGEQNENHRQNLPAAKSAIGKNASPPVANSRNHQRQILPTNLVREPLTEPVSLPPLPPRSDFDAFWDAAPRKVGKGAARKAYDKALRLTDAATLFSAMKAYAAERRGKEEQYTVHPATWLNQERWNDEPQQQSDAVSDAQRAAELFRRKRGMDSGQGQGSVVPLLPARRG